MPALPEGSEWPIVMTAGGWEVNMSLVWLAREKDELNARLQPWMLEVRWR